MTARLTRPKKSLSKSRRVLEMKSKTSAIKAPAFLNVPSIPGKNTSTDCFDPNFNPNIIVAVNKQIDRIRPIMQAHKGGVSIIKATATELVLNLEGHCAGCAMAPMTFGLVLEKYIREALPQLKEIKYVSNEPLWQK